MSEEYLPSAHYLQEKFQEWFRDPIPPEATHSKEDPAPTDQQFHAAEHYSYYMARSSREEALQRLFGMFISGLQGAVFFGIVVGFIILMMYVNYLEWSKYWPKPAIVVLLAMAVGFWGGLLRGSIYQLRKKYSYKNKL